MNLFRGVFFTSEANVSILSFFLVFNIFRNCSAFFQELERQGHFLTVLKLCDTSNTSNN